MHREIWGDFFDGEIFQTLRQLTVNGHLGINLFFTLSGFLITYLLLWENDVKGKINLLRYLMRRTLRVWPLYFLIVLFGFFVFPHLPYGIETVHEFWRFALFLSNFDELIHGMNDSINFLSATWTVSVEEQFYLAWGVLIGIFSFRDKRFYYVFFSLIILGSIVFHGLKHDEPRTLYFHTFAVMSDVAFGGLMGLLAFSNKIQSYFVELKKPIIIACYLLGISMILFDGHILIGYAKVFHRIIPSLFFGFMIMEQVYSKHSFYKIDRIRGFYLSGEISYGFYMFHCIYLYYWSIFFDIRGWTDSPWDFILFFFSSLASTWITAYISYQLFEKQFLKLKKYFR